MSGRAWTTGELAELRRLVALGLTNKKIAKKMHRTTQAIANQKYIYSLKSPPNNAFRKNMKWRDWEDDLLQRLPRISARKAAEMLARTEEAVKARRKMLRKKERA